MNRLTVVFFPALLFALSIGPPHTALAQVGKLSGYVTQAGTETSLPGTNIILVETGQGAAANAEGYYSILNIDPGTYTIRASAIGFATKVVEEVRITAGRTTTFNITLSEEVLEGEEVVVVATRPIVDPNQTTSRALVSEEQIEALPAADLQDVLARTANAYEGYVRGSRRNETKTIVEGVDISEAFFSLPEGYATDYSNTIRAGKNDLRIFHLNPAAIEEVSVNTGAKPVQYSSATGGIVTVSLDEGRGPIRGTFSARIAPQINTPGPDSLGFYYDAGAYVAERETLLQQGDSSSVAKAQLYSWDRGQYSISEDPEVDLRATLGGEITDRWRFFVAGQWFQTHGYRPNEFTKRLGGLLKTTYDLSERTSLSAVAIVEDRGLWSDWNNRDYDDFWRFYLQGLAQHDGGSYLGTLQLTQLIGDHSYLKAQYYRTFHRVRRGYVDDDGDGFSEPGEDGAFIDFRDLDAIEKYIGSDEDERDKMFFTNISNPWSATGISNLEGDPYKLARPVVFSQDILSVTNGFKVDFSSQVTPHHFIEAGTELKLRRYTFDQVQGIDGLGATLNEEEEPYVPIQYERHPWELSFYASDRIEYGSLIVNLGMRVDFADRDMEKILDHFYPLRRDTVQVAGRPLARNFFRRGEAVPIDVLLNPSIGVSHPISERAAMYFSYAHSEQLPAYSTLYQFYDGNHSSNRFTDFQDPEREPLVSNNYELGVQWEFIEGWGLDVNAYMRSIDNRGSVLFIANNRTPEGQEMLDGLTEYRYQTDFGYVDVRGLEVRLHRRPLEIAEDIQLGLTASYTFSSAETARQTGDNQRRFQADGVESDELPFENTEDFSHFAQDISGGGSIVGRGYNRRHRGVLRLVADFPLDITLGVSGSLESGIQYPPVIGVDPRDRELLTGPTTYRIDLRLEKTFAFTERFGLDLYIDVINLTNHHNILAYDTFSTNGAALFQQTGIPSRRLVLPDGSPVYGPARNIYFGTELHF